MEPMVGCCVECQFDNNRWYSGKISDVHKNNFKVHFNDGDIVKFSVDDIGESVRLIPMKGQSRIKKEKCKPTIKPHKITTNKKPRKRIVKSSKYSNDNAIHNRFCNIEKIAEQILSVVSVPQPKFTMDHTPKDISKEEPSPNHDPLAGLRCAVFDSMKLSYGAIKIRKNVRVDMSEECFFTNVAVKCFPYLKGGGGKKWVVDLSQSVTPRKKREVLENIFGLFFIFRDSLAYETFINLNKAVTIEWSRISRELTAEFGAEKTVQERHLCTFKFFVSRENKGINI